MNDWVPGRIYEDRRVEMIYARSRWVKRPDQRSPVWRRFLCAILHSPLGWDRGVCPSCLTRHWG